VIFSVLFWRRNFELIAVIS